MIVVMESTASHSMSKPVMCPKCQRGKLGHIPAQSKTFVSRRGNAPPEARDEGVQVKCPVCRKTWTLTIE